MSKRGWIEKIFYLGLSVLLIGCVEKDGFTHISVNETKLVDEPTANKESLNYKFFIDKNQNSLPSLYKEKQPEINSLVIPLNLESEDMNFNYDKNDLEVAIEESKKVFEKKTRNNLRVNFVESSPLYLKDFLKDFLNNHSLTSNSYFYDFFHSIGNYVSTEIIAKMAESSFKKLDSNNDGFIDALVIVHNQKRPLEKNSITYQLFKNMTIKFIDTEISKKINQLVWINGYDLIQEKRYHYITHEFGHLLGIPDLYDLSDLTSPMGIEDEAGSIMSRSATSCFSPFERYLLGWDLPKFIISPSNLVTYQNKDLSLNVNQDDYLILENDDENTPFSQYLLLRPFKSINEPNKLYLFCYHVDARIESRKQNNELQKRFIKDIKNYASSDLTFAFSNTPNMVFDQYMKHPLIYMVGNKPNNRLDVLNKRNPVSSHFNVGDGINIKNDDYSFYGDNSYDNIEFGLGFYVKSISQDSISIQVFKRNSFNVLT